MRRGTAACVRPPARPPAVCSPCQSDCRPRLTPPPLTFHAPCHTTPRAICLQDVMPHNAMQVIKRRFQQSLSLLPLPASPYHHQQQQPAAFGGGSALGSPGWCGAGGPGAKLRSFTNVQSFTSSDVTSVASDLPPASALPLAAWRRTYDRQHSYTAASGPAASLASPPPYQQPQQQQQQLRSPPPILTAAPGQPGCRAPLRTSAPNASSGAGAGAGDGIAQPLASPQIARRGSVGSAAFLTEAAMSPVAAAASAAMARAHRGTLPAAHAHHQRSGSAVGIAAGAEGLASGGGAAGGQQAPDQAQPPAGADGAPAVRVLLRSITTPAGRSGSGHQLSINPACPPGYAPPHVTAATSPGAGSGGVDDVVYRSWHPNVSVLFAGESGPGAGGGADGHGPL